jgi:hypothetical protein
MAMYEWAAENLGAVEAARDVHDGPPAPPRALVAA